MLSRCVLEMELGLLTTRTPRPSHRRRASSAGSPSHIEKASAGSSASCPVTDAGWR